MKKRFNNTMIMPDEKEKQFQLSNNCWISEKLIDDDENVRDCCHVTKTFRGAAHWSIRT